MERQLETCPICNVDLSAEPNLQGWFSCPVCSRLINARSGAIRLDDEPHSEDTRPPYGRQRHPLEVA